MILTGEHHGMIVRHPLQGDETRVGRGSTNDLVLASQTVSRNHAVVRREGDALQIEDLGSLNGTRVNGTAVTGQASAALGDTVEFGSVLLRVTDGSEPTGSAPLFSAENDISQSVVLSRDDISKSRSHITGSEIVLQLLTDASQLLVLPETPDETFDRLLELVEKAMPTDRILILVSEAPGQDPIQRAARIDGDRAIGRLMLSRTMVRMVVDEGAAFLTGDAQSDERFMNQQSIVAQDLRSAMAVPLLHHEEVLGVLYVDTNDPSTTYTEQDLRVLTVVGQMVGAKLANARLLEIAREQERMAEELKTAQNIQRRLLPQSCPDIENWEFVAHHETCDAVGGDFFDYGRPADNRVHACLGDVSGHGIPAALLMSDCLATVRALRATGEAPGPLVSRLDRHLLRSTEPEHYMTFFLAEFDLESSTVRAVNAGHPPAYVLLPDGGFQKLESTGMPVGLVDLPKDYEEATCDFPPGATLLIYSDGITEALRGDEQFGDHRFEVVLKELCGAPAEEVVKRLDSEVRSWLGDVGQDDDLTLVVIRRGN